MEAWRFGFDPALPPAFKFDPTDADLVAFYLLPRALGIPNPHAHAVVDADPGSCPPWELLRRHGHAGSDHAFFFGPPREISENGSVARAGRRVPAGEDGVPGMWRGQKGQDERLTLARAGGGELVVVTFKKYNLTYYNVQGESDGEERISASGWVMQEYQIVDPPLKPGVVLARVKIADRATKQHRKKRKAAAAAAGQTVSYVPYYQLDQPGPSNYYDCNGQAAGTSGSAQVFLVPESQNGGGGDSMEEPVVNYNDALLHSGEVCVDDSNNYVFENNMGAYFNHGYAAAGSSSYGGSSDYYEYDDAAAA